MAYTTAIRGLSAQGNDEFTGMCYSNNDVSFTMTSSEFANSGFKYIVNVIDNITFKEYKFYIAPNASGSGVFNAKTIFNELVPTSLVIPDSDDILIQITEPLVSNEMMVNRFNVQLYEGYDVAGVFTEDNSVQITYELMCVYGKGKSNFLVMGSNDTPPLALSECFDNTIGFNAETIASRINIPNDLQQEVINWQRISRSNVTGAEYSAFKILSFIADNGTYLNINYPLIGYTVGFQYTFYDNEYNIILQFIKPMVNSSGALYHLPVGLYNLKDSIDDELMDSIQFWTVYGYDAQGFQITAKYGFYIDEDCKHNPVHVYWLNQKGGWDSYSFIKKNERSIDVEKKRYKQYLGDYNNATVDNPFDTKNYSRSLTEREPIVKTYINLNSDWVTESEFKFMKDLFQSKSVWMVDDNVDGYNILPVVVEDTNFLMRRERNSRKYNQSLRLQLANEYDTINSTLSQYPIPTPEPCDYITSFTALTGYGTNLVIQGIVGNSCYIEAVNCPSAAYLYVGVSPITPGQTYYVQIDYDTNIPYTELKPGAIDLGNVATGGGTRTYFSMQTAGTPIIASGVWGTGTPELFRFQIPKWYGTGKYEGNIYITIGFGNCP